MALGPTSLPSPAASFCFGRWLQLARVGRDADAPPLAGEVASAAKREGARVPENNVEGHAIGTRTRSRPPPQEAGEEEARRGGKDSATLARIGGANHIVPWWVFGRNVPMSGFNVFAIVLVALAVLTLFAGVKTVTQGYNWTVERFGRYTRTLHPGLNLIVPFFD